MALRYDDRTINIVVFIIIIIIIIIMLMTHSCTSINVTTKSRHPSANLSAATWTLIGHWMSANRLKLNTDKTELLFASSRHSCATLSGRYPVLQLGADTTVSCSHVHLFGVDI